MPQGEGKIPKENSKNTNGEDEKGERGRVGRGPMKGRKTI